MCGIAGYVGSRSIDDASIRSCLALMSRRGPDQQSAIVEEPAADRRVYLLSSRLSIIDLDPRADQPMQMDDCVLSFNGELYNYLEVKSRLASEGERFTTESDTEVMLRSLNRMGLDALDVCEGMWAFAFYDRRTGDLTLSRDRFGEKPLYLYRDDTGLYFGSELKFITALRGRAFAVNHDHLYRYLVNGYKALYKEPNAFFEGVEELAPGTALVESVEEGPKRVRYWNPAFRPVEDMTYQEAVEVTQDALIRSMQLRLRADVPLAFCMSGGIDSNSLIAIAKKTLNYDVHGFTIVNTDERYEETELVDLAVDQLDIRHTAVPLDTTGFLDNLRILVRQHDAPVYTVTYYAHWLLMESIAEQGYRISISGTAADELFSGYYDHHLAYLYEVRNDPQLHEVSVRYWEQHIQPLVRNPFLSDPDLFVKDKDFRDHIYLGSERFAATLTHPWAEPFRETSYTSDVLRNRMMNEMFHEAVPVILHEDDLNAMYFSVENRSPFLDRRLFETANSIPTRHLIRNGYAKAILRDAVSGIAPEPILRNHRKVGFNAPVFSFLNVADPKVRATVLEDSPIFDHVSRSHVESYLDREALMNSESKFLFSFLNAKLFLEEFAP